MKGWRYEAFRHSLAAKGVKTWQKENKALVKPFPGDNPRLTKEFARFRQEDPGKYDKFRIKKTKTGKELVFGHNKKTGVWEVQSVLVPRKSMASKDYLFIGATDENPRQFIKENLESHEDHSIGHYAKGVEYVLKHPFKDLDGDWVSYNEAAGNHVELSKHPVERAEERGAALFGRVLSQANMEPLIERGQGRTFREITGDILFGRRSGVTSDSELHKKKWHDQIPGGMADKKWPSDFDQHQLAKGVKVEMEHTLSPVLAKEIAMDHLTEFPNYYVELKKMEKRMEEAK
jgi:hypothetical protein